MNHAIHRITRFEHVADFSLRLWFDDGSERTIYFAPILEGELFGPLRDPEEFGRVKLDPETHTIVWPSGADFDPTTLHDWPKHEAAFLAMAKKWAHAAA